MDIVEYQALYQQVLWGAFALAVFFGLVAQRTHFCTMGAVSDIVTMGDWTRMRMWALAVGVAILGFYGLVAADWIDPGMTIYAGPRIIWLSAAVGGALFGFGMVLASGCGSKTLVRIGGGSLKSLVVFVVMAVSAYATLRGVVAVLRVNTLDKVAFEWTTGSRVPQWFEATGLSAELAGPLAAVLAGGALLWWALRDADLRTPMGLLGGLALQPPYCGAAARFVQRRRAAHPPATGRGGAEALSDSPRAVPRRGARPRKHGVPR